MEALKYVVLQADIVKAAQAAGLVTTDYVLASNSVKAYESFIPTLLKILEAAGVAIPAQVDAFAGALPMLLQLLGVKGA